MNFDEKNTPQIHIAAEHKAINPDKIPKRKEEKQPDFYEMSIDELLAYAVAHLSMKVNMQHYTDQYDVRNTKAKVQKLDMVALRTLERAFLMHLVKDHGYGEILLKLGD